MDTTNITWDNFFHLSPWIETTESDMFGFAWSGSIFNTQFTGHATEYINVEVQLYTGTTTEPSAQIGSQIIYNIPDYSEKLDQIYFILYDIKIILLLCMFTGLTIMFIKLYSRYLHHNKLKG